MWEHQTLLEKLFSAGIVGILLQQLLGNLKAAHLVLTAHLAFTTLPWMEDAVINQRLSLFVAAQHIEQSGMFEHEVVAALYQLGMLLVEGQALGMRTVQALVKLVELHEDALIVLVEMEGLFHILQSLFLIALLVKASESQVTPYGWERRIELG